MQIIITQAELNASKNLYRIMFENMPMAPEIKEEIIKALDTPLDQLGVHPFIDVSQPGLLAINIPESNVVDTFDLINKYLPQVMPSIVALIGTAEVIQKQVKMVTNLVKVNTNIFNRFSGELAVLAEKMEKGETTTASGTVDGAATGGWDKI